MSDNVPQRFSTHVLEREYVTVDELVSELELKEITVRNYLSRMKREGLLRRVGRGRYVVERGVVYAPALPEALERVLAMIRDAFPQMSPVVWSSSMLSEYMHNVPGRDLIAIDVPKSAVRRLADHLAARDVLVFRDPSPDTLDSFAWSNLDAVFLFGRGETVASIPLDRFRMATVERVWTDLYFLCTRRDLPFPLEELGVVLRNAYRSGVLSVDRMLTYSSRRGLRSEVLLILVELGRRHPELGALKDVLPHGERVLEWIEAIITGASEGW